MAKQENKTTAKLLADALALMNDSGRHWMQGDYMAKDEEGVTRYCSVGAIDVVAERTALPDIWRDRAINALAHGLPKGLGKVHNSVRVVAWNDNEKRKWPDIVARFEKTIERLETTP